MIWEKAQELYQMEQAKTMGKDFKGTTATRKELWEGGYFYQAKLIVKKPMAKKERLACLIKVCGFLLQTKVYLFWKNLNV
jgi:hypothetical protein